MANLYTLQSKGWLLTTLTEVRNRADFVLLAGTDADSVCPRFFERILRPQLTMTGRGGTSRRIAGLGVPRRTVIRRELQVDIPCQSGNLLQMLSKLRSCLLHSRTKGRPAARHRNLLPDLADAMRAAGYGVVVWAPAMLSRPDADLTVDVICDLVSILNETTRFAGLSLGGHDGGVTFANVCTWQSGYPGRVKFAKDGPEYDPVLYSTEAMIRQGAADTLLWISSFSGSAQAPQFAGSLIALANPSKELAATAEVFIPVGTPGVHHSGTIFRTDNIVGLPASGISPSMLPSVATVLSEIQRAL